MRHLEMEIERYAAISEYTPSGSRIFMKILLTKIVLYIMRIYNS